MKYSIASHTLLTLERLKRDHKMSEMIDKKTTTHIQHPTFKRKEKKKNGMLSNLLFSNTETKRFDDDLYKFSTFRSTFCCIVDCVDYLFYDVTSLMVYTYLPNTKLWQAMYDQWSDMEWSGMEWNRVVWCGLICVCSHII